MQRRYEGKVAVITAGAGGIGRATARIIAAEGGMVVAVDVNEPALEALQAEFDTAGQRGLCLKADGLEAAAVDQVVETALAEFGTVDILVNALGGGTIIAKMGAYIDEMILEEWQALIHFNLTGTFLFCNRLVPVMKRAGTGKIVNVSSMAGRGVTKTSSSAYVAAKAGIIALTKKLSLELGPFGINVNAVAPGLTLSERLIPHWEKRSAEVQAEQIERIPLRRIGTPEDQAKVICFLASSDADFVTGLTLDVTGGQ